MSLLMEALKKAEQAKRKISEGPVVVTPASPALALELTPADAVIAKPQPVNVPEKPAVSAAPALTAAAFTLMTGRVAEVTPPIARAPAPVEVAAPPVSVAPAAPPKIIPLPSKPELSLDTSASVKNSTPVSRPMPPRRRISLVWIAAGISLVLTLCGGGYWYYHSMAQYLTQQSTLGAPQPGLAAPDAITAPPATVVPPTVTVPIKPAAVAAVKTKPQVKRPSIENASVASSPASANAITSAVPAPIVVVPKDVSGAGVVAAESLPVPPPAPISVSRDAQQNDTFVALQTAYRAYQSGDDGNAQNLYARVLSHDEHNRDALLGLAAIAVRQKDVVRAQEIYSELLTLDPKDSIAQAGFVSVSGSFDPLQQEARIKALLEQEPGAPHLLFTYATFLMQQQRWLEATRTLQSAVQAQRDNADYAFNLAVSFDHLGQADAATKYYRAALELATKQATRFRPEDVRRRLKAMDAVSGGGTTP